eukprot:48031_1
MWSRLSLLSLAFAISLCASSSGSSDNSDSSEDCNNNDWEVQYFASRAHFRVYNPCNSKQYFQVNMESLTEYDSNSEATSNQISSFDSVNGNWDNSDFGDDNEYEGNSVFSNIFRADIIGEGVNFVLETIFFRYDASIYNNSVTLNQYSLKWNVDLINWPFLNVNNTLQLCVNTTTNNAERGRKDSSSSDHTNDVNDANDSDDSNESDENTLNEWNIGNFGLQTLSYADCDGSENIAVAVKDETNDNPNERNICFTFDYCESGTISYDPIISYIANENDSGLTIGEKAAIGVSVVMVFFIACGVILYCVYRRKKHGSYEGLLDIKTKNVEGTGDGSKEGVSSVPYDNK